MKAALLVLLVLCVLAAGVGAWLYTPDISAGVLRTRYHVGPNDFVEAAGIRLRVKESGPAGAPVVILLHGFGGSLETWDGWTPELATRFRVVALDLPGFGLTGPDPTGDYADARAGQILIALLDRLGVGQASLVGNSLGGRIAWMFAAAHPERVSRLVLISPDGFASPGFEYGKQADLPLLMKALPYTLPRFMLRMNLAVAYADKAKLTDATVTRYRDFMRGPGDRAAMLARMQQVLLEPPGPTLRRITAPTLVLWGEQDGMIPFSNAADYVRDIPGARLVALPGLGHVPFEEAPAESLPPVMAFLQGK